MSSLTGNAWGTKQGKAAGAGAGATSATAQAQPDSHLPVKDFNANEVKEFLKKSTSAMRLWLHVWPLTQLQSTSRAPPVRASHHTNIRAHGMGRTNITCVDQVSVYHKVPGDSVSNRSSGAWGKGGKAFWNTALRHHMLTCTGTLPHLMPTGQDFFTQLKKQLASLDQTKPAQ